MLRGEWGFGGVTVSDFVWGLRDAAKSLRAGLDVEEPFAQQRAQYLPDALQTGEVTWEHVDRVPVAFSAPSCARTRHAMPLSLPHRWCSRRGTVLSPATLPLEAWCCSRTRQSGAPPCYPSIRVH
ncbi:MAG: beta-glucosidase [Mycobacterium sp.]|nr:family 3 glycosyl hydrolase [Mycobacterium sp.]MDT5058571.1 beta-glucosidase [Mycobacterium sp.]MDT5310434.1 beta-glucosidase [Mycobacterium sp.]